MVYDNEKDGFYRDYAEEAIPERDPGYRLPHATGHGLPTVEAMSAELSRELARCLEQLRMSRTRAKAV